MGAAWLKSNWLEKYLYLAILLAIIVVSIAVRYNDLSSYPYHEDSLVTIDIVEKIASGNIPFADDSFLRAPLSQFLIALPLFFVDGNDVSYRYANLFFSGLLLVYAYLFGLAVGRPWVGILCAAFLGFSSFENIDVTFIRFYFIFKVFFFACVYYVFKVFIKKQVVNWWPLLLSIFLLIFMHQLCLQIFVVVFIATLFAGRQFVIENKKYFVGTMALLMLACIYHFWGNFSFNPRDSHEYQMFRVGALYFSGQYFALYDYFRDFAPFGWSLILSTVILYPKSRDRDGLFLFVAFLVLFVATSALATALAPRFISHLFPLGVFIAINTLSVMGEVCLAAIRNREMTPLVVGSLPLVVVLLLALAGFENVKNFRVMGRTHTFPDQARPHHALREQSNAADLVLTVDPSLTEYYLRGKIAAGNIYFLRQKFDFETRSFSPFSADTGLNNLIDEPSELERLLSTGGRRVWLYANYKYQEAVGPELRAIVSRHLGRVAYYDNENEIFVFELQ